MKKRLVCRVIGHRWTRFGIESCARTYRGYPFRVCGRCEAKQGGVPRSAHEQKRDQALTDLIRDGESMGVYDKPPAEE